MPRHIPLVLAVAAAVACLGDAASAACCDTPAREWAPLQIVLAQAGLSPAMSRNPGGPAPLQSTISQDEGAVTAFVPPVAGLPRGTTTARR